MLGTITVLVLAFALALALALEPEAEVEVAWYAEESGMAVPACVVIPVAAPAAVAAVEFCA